MDPVIAFRSNALGNLLPNRAQRNQALLNVTSNFRAKLDALSGRGAQAKAVQAAYAKSVADAGGSQKASTTSAKAGANNELDRDAYLQLLVTQLSNQDPLDPVDNSQMIAQLAQFSSLEQMQNLNDSFETLTGNVDQLNFISAQGLLGRYVEGLDLDGNPIKGEVESVALNGSIVVLTVGGKPMAMSGVMAIADKVPPEAEKSGGKASTPVDMGQ